MNQDVYLSAKTPHNNLCFFFDFISTRKKQCGSKINIDDMKIQIKKKK